MRREDWYDPQSAWWAKHGHAKTHHARLAEVCADFRDANPIEVRAEPTNEPGKTAYVLYESAPIPLEISLIVGDVLHCLRSCLDSLVYGIVRAELQGGMGREEEQACQFPIYPSPSKFDDFFTKHKVRNAIMDDSLRRILRGVQPFYHLENYIKLRPEVAAEHSYGNDAVASTLWHIAQLSNIDKHRRLAVTTWWPGLFYWTHNGENQHQWLPSGQAPWKSGEVIGYLLGAGPAPLSVVHEFKLALLDDPPFGSATRDLPDEVEGWISEINRILHQVLREYV